MTPRETKTITTPGGVVVEVKSYLTGREADAIDAVLTAGIKVNVADMVSGETTIDDMPASIVADQEAKALEVMLVSINGDTEDVYNKVLDLREDEYKFIKQQAKEIRTPLAETK